jgi:hypothetical protein
LNVAACAIGEELALRRSWQSGCSHGHPPNKRLFYGAHSFEAPSFGASAFRVKAAASRLCRFDIDVTADFSEHLRHNIEEMRHMRGCRFSKGVRRSTSTVPMNQRGTEKGKRAGPGARIQSPGAM